MRILVATLLFALLGAWSAALAQPPAKPAVPAMERKCKATKDGATLVEATGQGVVACLKNLKEKILQEKCTQGVYGFEYLAHTEVSPGRWTPGTRAHVRCKQD
jgi:hypothetical protein